MLRTLLATLVLITGCSSALADQSSLGQDASYAIANPLRPGSKAPSCETQKETADGCTFHSVAGATYAAVLPITLGETWIATASDTHAVKVEAASGKSAPVSNLYQSIMIIPNPQKNADATVTFDKLTGEPGSVKVIERRRINVMIHPS